MEAARRIEVIYDVTAAHDGWLLDEENMPESALHQAIIHVLLEVLHAWTRREGGRAMAGSNLALRWNEANPRQGVDPDVYVVDPAPPEGEGVTSLCLWKPGHHPPRLAVEVVSESTAAKDYSDGPDRYAMSGTRELWVFDPLLAGPETMGGPHRLQVWRRDERGRFRRVYTGEGPARSEELGAWIVVTDEARRLRIADDDRGEHLWPTAAEAAEAEIARLREELARRDAAEK
jgi:Uma2 family endonuclease